MNKPAAITNTQSNAVVKFKLIVKRVIAYLFPAGKLDKARRQKQYKDFFFFLAAGLAFYYFEKKIQGLINVQPGDLKALQDQALSAPPPM